MMLGDIGGLQSCLIMVGIFFVQFLQRKMFLAALVKNIY
jgi:hypothetical protein